MKASTLFTAAAMVLLASGVSQAQDRHPPMLPEWLWRDDPSFSALIIEQRREKTSTLLKEFYDKASTNFIEAEVSLDSARDQIHNNIGAVDFARHGKTLTDERTGDRLIVAIDPLVPNPARQTIEKALLLLVKHGADDDVIGPAFDQASPNPTPVPEKFNTGPDGKQTLNWAYLSYARGRTKPPSASALKEEIAAALKSSVDGLPAIFIVTTGTSTNWPTSAYFDWHISPALQLRRTKAAPTFYSQVHLPALSEGSARFDDPRYWASRLMGSVMNNLGYWTPQFSSPAERDEKAKDGNVSLNVMMTRQLLAKLDRSYP